jgi:hypothetical protein
MTTTAIYPTCASEPVKDFQWDDYLSYDDETNFDGQVGIPPLSPASYGLPTSTSTPAEDSQWNPDHCDEDEVQESHSVPSSDRDDLPTLSDIFSPKPIVLQKPVLSLPTRPTEHGPLDDADRLPDLQISPLPSRNSAPQSPLSAESPAPKPGGNKATRNKASPPSDTDKLVKGSSPGWSRP